ncbi:MAG: type II toxin-antitoxin system RelE/ParE family toxin [Acidobacteriaceae bacterium]
MSLSFAPAAIRELLEAEDWYEQQKIGLSRRFLDDLYACADRIQQHPMAYRLIARNLRRASLSSFPYYLLFRLWNDSIEVVVVAHASRRPAYWSDRVSQV